MLWYAMLLLLKSKTMLHKSKLIRKLKFELQATQEHYDEKLSCYKHKDSHGRSFHHGDIIMPSHFSHIVAEMSLIKACISQALQLAYNAPKDQCDIIWNKYLSFEN